MNVKKIIFLLLVIFLSFNIPSIAIEEIVAKYKNGKVTEKELKLYFNYLGYPDSDPLKTFKTSTDNYTLQELRNVIDSIVSDIIWDNNFAPLATMKNYNLPEKQINLIDDTYNNCVFQNWSMSISDSLTTLTKSEIANVFSKYSQDFEFPEMREVSYIFKMTSDTLTMSEKNKIYEQIKNIHDEIRNKKIKFDEAARLYSEAPSAAQGGFIGLVRKDAKFNKNFMNLVFSTEDKQLSPVTLLHNGYYIIYIHSIIPEQKITEEKLFSSDEIQKQLLNYAKDDLIANKIKDAKNKFPETKDDYEAVFKLIKSQGYKYDDCEILKQLISNRLYARGYFYEKHKQDFEPTESEITDYYNQNPHEMYEEGQWKLTKFIVEVKGEKDSKVKSRVEAIEIMNKILDELKSGVDESIVEEKYRSYNLQILSTTGWVNGSNFAKADNELLQMKPSELTSVFYDKEGAFFFRLDDKRSLPKQSLEQKREYIVNNLRALKYDKLYQKERDELILKLDLQKEWLKK